MEFFHYISASKVVMMESQLKRKSSASAKIGVNLGAIYGEISTENAEPDENLVVKLSKLREYILSNYNLDQLGKSKVLSRDEMEVSNVSIKGHPSMYCLIGNNDNGTHLICGTRTSLVWGADVPTVDVKGSYSYFPDIVSIILTHLEETTDFSAQTFAAGGQNSVDPTNNTSAFRANELANIVRFLAKKAETEPKITVDIMTFPFFLGESTTGDSSVYTISSPLYVSSVLSGDRKTFFEKWRHRILGK